MPNVWTATNIVVTKVEYDIVIPPSNPDAAWLAGNKATEFKFKSDVLVDGVLHHHYNEPHVPPHPTLSPEDNVSRIIQNHLVHWTASGLIATTIPVPDVAVPVEKVPTQYEIDLATFQAAQSDYIKKYNANASAVAAKQTPPFSDKELADAFEAWKVAVSVAPGFWEFVPKDFPYPA
jgi:hypothetical protein